MSAMVTRATPFGHDQDNLSVLCPFFKDCATNLARSLVRYLAPASCINNLQVIFSVTPRADDMFHRKNMAPDSQERQPLPQVVHCVGRFKVIHIAQFFRVGRADRMVLLLDAQ